VSHATADVEQLNLALAAVMFNDHQQLIKAMVAVRSLGKTRPPVVMALACVVVAELSLRQAGLPINDDVMLKLYSLATEITTRLAVAVDVPDSVAPPLAQPS
jgi:hypothetical protein